MNIHDLLGVSSQFSVSATLMRVFISMLCGVLIGIERSYNGRAAGTRTYTLVCVASTFIMQAVAYLILEHPAESMDQTRVIQGIMTGIGFLGAGVIVKDGFNVRGLTTAASIWMAAVIGTLAGMGMEILALLAALLTVFILWAYRYLERVIPGKKYSHLSIKVKQEAMMQEEEIERLLENCGFNIVEFAYKQGKEGKYLEYKLIVWTGDKRNNSLLARTLYPISAITEFGMSPSSD